MKKNIFLFFVLMSYSLVSGQALQPKQEPTREVIREVITETKAQQPSILSDKLIEQQQSLAQLIEAKERLEEDLTYGINGLQRRDKKEILKVLELHKKAIAKKLAELELLTPEDEEYEQNTSEWTTTQRVLLWTVGSLIVLTTATGIFLAMYDINTGGLHTPSNNLLKRNIASMLETKASRKKSVTQEEEKETKGNDGDDSDDSDSDDDDSDDTPKRTPKVQLKKKALVKTKKARKTVRKKARINGNPEELTGSPEDIDLSEHEVDDLDTIQSLEDLERHNHEEEKEEAPIKRYGKKAPAPVKRKTRSSAQAKAKPKTKRDGQSGANNAETEDKDTDKNTDDDKVSDPFATREDKNLEKDREELARLNQRREELERELAAGNSDEQKDPEGKAPVTLGNPGIARTAANWIGTSRPVTAVKRAGNWVRSWWS